MEEETRKKNTDCLYFLASPLTCKKGIECEYRHSDSARLNPRDCWYWLNGNCRNPICAFRHPPLEEINGVKADTYYTPSFSAVSTSKPNVPCYFYFNAICSKGDQCPFLHNEFHSQKLVSKPAHESAAANHPLENKISSCDTGPASVELPVYPPTESLTETIKANKHNPKEVSCSPSVESLVPEFEEPLAGNPLPSIEILDPRGELSPYSSSEEIVKESIEPDLEERWESSPGFDVLVDDGSEHLAYEDDAEYQLVQNRESELRHSHLLEYDFEGSGGYEHHTGYPDTGYVYDGLYENYDHADDIYATRNYYQLKLRGEERKFEPMHDNHGKQKLLRRVHDAHDRDFMVFHECLGKHRRMDARWIDSNSRKRRRSNPHGSSQERPTRRGIKNGSIHCRLTSQVGRCMIAASSNVEDEFTHNYHDRQGWRGHSGTGRLARPRYRERERRRRRFSPHFSSKVQQSSACDEEESVRSKSSGGFDGPKTLAQIKEEKSRAKADDGNNYVEYLPRLQRRRQAAADFEGPKPLEELLKHKRSERPPPTSKCEELEHFDNADCLANGDDDEDYDDKDDDDTFRNRLFHMLSH